MAPVTMDLPTLVHDVDSQVHDITSRPGYVNPMYIVSATKLPLETRAKKDFWVAAEATLELMATASTFPR